MTKRVPCCPCGMPAAITRVSGSRYGTGERALRFVVVCRVCGRHDTLVDDDDDADNAIEDGVRAFEDADMAFSDYSDYQ